MSLFAVAGHPVAHSRSPALHHAWYEALGIDASYGRVDVDPASLPDGPQLLQRFDQLGLSGVNLTVPLKQLCMEAVVTLDPAAHLAGAINTLVREPDGWHGSNTDLEGFRRGAKALTVGTGFRVRVEHPGTRGKHPFERGVELAGKDTKKIFKREIGLALEKAWG